MRRRLLDLVAVEGSDRTAGVVAVDRPDANALELATRRGETLRFA